jgi:hypothetical protein
MVRAIIISFKHEYVVHKAVLALRICFQLNQIFSYKLLRRSVRAERLILNFGFYLVTKYASSPCLNLAWATIFEINPNVL